MRMQIVIAAAVGILAASLASAIFLFLGHQNATAPSASPVQHQPIELARASCHAAATAEYERLKGLSPQQACGCIFTGYEMLDFANQSYAMSIYQRAEANAPTAPQEREAYDRTLRQRMTSLLQQDGYTNPGMGMNFAQALQKLNQYAFSNECVTFLFR